MHIGETIDLNKRFPKKCPRPYCGIGKYLYFGEITKPYGLWNESYGWTCRQCPANHYKLNSSSDNTTCSPCPLQTVAKKDQSGCYDPYRKIFIRIEFRSLGLIPTSICGIGSLFTMATIIVFVALRKTPFVRATDLPNSLLHLTSTLLLFVALPILFVGEPTNLKCTLQPISVLLLCVCPSVIIMTKSQKILVAFRSKTRLSTREKRKSTAMQYSFTGIVLLIDAAILLLAFISIKPRNQVSFDHENYTKTLTCNTGHHLNTQVAILILQYLSTTVQAYRGRSLPGPFNEAMNIVYSTFIVVVTYLVIFPIHYMQQDVLVKFSIHFLVIPAASVLFNFVYYGPKLFVVIFEPHKNTRTYFQRKMMEDARGKVQSQCDQVKKQKFNK